MSSAPETSPVPHDTAAPTAPGTARPVRPVRPQIVLEVLERIQLSPHLVRIVAGGPGVTAVEDNGQTDAYSKMLFAHPATALTPPYDLDALRDELPAEHMPATRTYSIRRFQLDADSPEAGQIWIDFVVHGDEGIAGPWANTARVGDPVVLRGIGGGYAPNPDADWHLLGGDESAIPAIASALEAMPENAVGNAYIEVQGTEDVLDISAPEGVTVHWLFRGAAAAGTSSVLVDAIRSAEWLPGTPQVFVHGERGAIKLIRPLLTEERGLDRAALSISPYWAYGRREDRFQAEKREEIGQI